MKHLLFVLAVVVLTAAVAFSQGLQPNGPKTTSQYSRSIMTRGPHDFTADSSGLVRGASNSLCGYCHAAHIPAEGVGVPLWSRKSVTSFGGTYGVYSNPISFDAYTSIADAKSSDNYSSFCLSCHDGSALFALSRYEKRPRTATGQTWDTTLAVSPEANMVSGEYRMDHTHPVNFDYNAALATNDGGLFNPANDRYVLLDNSTSPPTSIGRLFNGKMQCSSCHNPHMSSGIGIQGTTTYSKLCIACHKK